MRSIVFAVTLSLLVPAAGSYAAQFAVKPGAPNQVVFTSKATTETFKGKTDRLQGRIDFDPAGIGDSVTVRLEVDLTGSRHRYRQAQPDHARRLPRNQEIPARRF
jgi:polyisoprenoid-binding protein YceI